MLAAFGVLLAALWRMQVAHGKSYQRDLMKQSVRRVRLPGHARQIFDRNGVCVADNRPSYCIAIYLEELRQPGRWAKTIGHVNSLIDELSATLGVPRQITDGRHPDAHQEAPAPAAAGLARPGRARRMARLAERAAKVPGVDIYAEAVRAVPVYELGLPRDRLRRPRRPAEGRGGVLPLLPARNGRQVGPREDVRRRPARRAGRAARPRGRLRVPPRRSRRPRAAERPRHCAVARPARAAAGRGGAGRTWSARR